MTCKLVAIHYTLYTASSQRILPLRPSQEFLDRNFRFGRGVHLTDTGRGVQPCTPLFYWGWGVRFVRSRNVERPSARLVFFHICWPPGHSIWPGSHWCWMCSLRGQVIVPTCCIGWLAGQVGWPARPVEQAGWLAGWPGGGAAVWLGVYQQVTHNISLIGIC